MAFKVVVNSLLVCHLDEVIQRSSETVFSGQVRE